MEVLARIALRYGIGGLVAWGLLDSDLGELIQGDADILLYTQIAIGAVAAVVTEGWYLLAKRWGWKT